MRTACLAVFVLVIVGFQSLNSQSRSPQPRHGMAEYFKRRVLAAADVEKTVLKQAAGTHADEGETSMMLFIAPKSVDMRKAGF